MHFTADFCMRHYAGFSQIGSHSMRNLSVLKEILESLTRYLPSSNTPLPGGRLAVDSSIYPPPLPVFIVVKHNIGRCIMGSLYFLFPTHAVGLWNAFH